MGWPMISPERSHGCIAPGVDAQQSLIAFFLLQIRNSNLTHLQRVRYRRYVIEKRILLLLDDRGNAVSQNRIGIIRYARPHTPWIFLRLNPSLPNLMRLARAWNPHGGIGRVGREDLIRLVRRLGIPFVNIHGGRQFPEIPQVGTDDQAIGRMAADHLARLGFRHFGYFGLLEPGRGGFASERGKGFAAALQKRGHGVEIFDWNRNYPGRASRIACTLWAEKRWQRWLRWLPKPVAIFACDDLRAQWLADVCYRLGLHIPEEVALIGAGGDELECQTAWPSLSTVCIPSATEGYEAARLLERLLAGQAPPTEPILLSPDRVLTAASTELSAVADPRLGRALRYIREHGHEKCPIEKVAQQAGVSRRVLENLFRQQLKTTPFKELRLLRLERACQLLRETNDSLEMIVERIGYSCRSRLATDFRRQMGVTPVRYRKHQHPVPGSSA